MSYYQYPDRDPLRTVPNYEWSERDRNLARQWLQLDFVIYEPGALVLHRSLPRVQKHLITVSILPDMNERAVPTFARKFIQGVC
jgi:hypothetical protein